MRKKNRLMKIFRSGIWRIFTILRSSKYYFWWWRYMYWSKLNSQMRDVFEQPSLWLLGLQLWESLPLVSSSCDVLLWKKIPLQLHLFANYYYWSEPPELNSSNWAYCIFSPKRLHIFFILLRPKDAISTAQTLYGEHTLLSVLRAFGSEPSSLNHYKLLRRIVVWTLHEIHDLKWFRHSTRARVYLQYSTVRYCTVVQYGVHYVPSYTDKISVGVNRWVLLQVRRIAERALLFPPGIIALLSAGKRGSYTIIHGGAQYTTRVNVQG
jgi:hypothetical protein